MADEIKLYATINGVRCDIINSRVTAVTDENGENIAEHFSEIESMLGDISTILDQVVDVPEESATSDEESTEGGTE